jgi:Ubiquitinol-cytochrome C reductase Fe-S subunit TAT signal
MTNERHTRREFLGIAGAGVAGVATGASFDHKRSEKTVAFLVAQ